MVYLTAVHAAVSVVVWPAVGPKVNTFVDAFQPVV